MRNWLVSIAVSGFLLSCGINKNPFLLSEVHFLNNIPNAKDSLINFPVNLDDAVLNGIEIPSKNQTPNGYFNYSFKIKNTGDRVQQFFYKIYYQNETYKFNEDNSLASENFYGSWENKKYIFKKTKPISPEEEIEVTDSFRIVGNPRNEKVFFGSDPTQHLVNDESIRGTIDYIKKTPDWMGQLPAKAEKNKVSVDQQLYADALWSLSDQKQRDSSSNNRWKRNPRVGVYEFLLVVTTPEDFENISPWVKDISQKNDSGNFVNPFGYFKRNLLQLKNTQVIKSDKKLFTRAAIDLSKGIYINPLSLNNLNFTKEYYNQTCSDSFTSYKNAQVELFFHNINRDYVLHNIPEARDVTGENYTRIQYEEGIKKYENSGKLINTYVNSTECPCKNVSVNKKENSITIKNPGNKPGEFKKEHVGLVTRIGFTYGKFRAKIKFPETMSKDNVWNGITNAFWMMAQDVNLNWNMRRICNSDIAYIPKQEPDNEEALRHSKKQITYSEIDFEILKESEFWPKSSYQISNVPYKADDSYNDHNITVTCTNWDMACHQPEFFNIGAMEHVIDGNKYIHHRWQKWYKALTTKVSAPHDELFKSDYYFYEIEWTPEKIVWRIGPQKDKMKPICVMDKNVTAIPNNQMLMIITQEWHNQEWWPLAPFKQNFIPFPKNDIIGKVLELEIE